MCRNCQCIYLHVHVHVYMGKGGLPILLIITGLRTHETRAAFAKVYCMYMYRYA